MGIGEWCVWIWAETGIVWRWLPALRLAPRSNTFFYGALFLPGKYFPLAQTEKQGNQPFPESSESWTFRAAAIVQRLKYVLCSFWFDPQKCICSLEHIPLSTAKHDPWAQSQKKPELCHVYPQHKQKNYTFSLNHNNAYSWHRGLLKNSSNVENFPIFHFTMHLKNILIHWPNYSVQKSLGMFGPWRPSGLNVQLSQNVLPKRLYWNIK